MHRIDGPGALTGGVFTDGDPAAGTPATVVTDDWANAVQDELCNVIIGAGIGLSKPNNAQLVAAIRALMKQRLPAGQIAAFGMVDPPPGWLECDGGLYLITSHPDLFIAIGTTWGGDGITTFRVPDLRGEFLRGFDHARGADPGRTFASTQTDAFKAHAHEMGSESGGGGNLATPVDSSGVDESVGGNLTSTVGGTETRPRNVAVLYCIRT